MNGGLVIQLHQCPRCGILRTTRRFDDSGRAFCFNCRLQFAVTAAPAQRTIEPALLERLRAYRAAVQAGFYNDIS
jgi:hypothetical protein